MVVKQADLDRDALIDMRVDLSYSIENDPVTEEWELYREGLRMQIAQAEGGQSAHLIAVAAPGTWTPRFSVAQLAEHTRIEIGKLTTSTWNCAALRAILFHKPSGVLRHLASQAAMYDILQSGANRDIRDVCNAILKERAPR